MVQECIVTVLLLTSIPLNSSQAGSFVEKDIHFSCVCTAASFFNQISKVTTRLLPGRRRTSLIHYTHYLLALLLLSLLSINCVKKYYCLLVRGWIKRKELIIAWKFKRALDLNICSSLDLSKFSSKNWKCFLDCWMFFKFWVFSICSSLDLFQVYFRTEIFFEC